MNLLKKRPQGEGAHQAIADLIVHLTYSDMMLMSSRIYQILSRVPNVTVQDALHLWAHEVTTGRATELEQAPKANIPPPGDPT